MLEQLKARDLPLLKDREQMLDILQRECYGYRPTEGTFSVGEPSKPWHGFGLGETNYDQVPFTVKTTKGEHTFPLHRVLHTDGKKRPFIVFMQFSAPRHALQFAPDIIAEQGFDILWFCYGEVTSDDGDFTNGVAPLFEKGCGKIALWSRVASLVMDYAETLPGLDKEHACIAGHSRLGKTALLTAALDTRFRYVFSNNAGRCGDALHRGNTGEQIADITDRFPYWFCEDFKQYAGQGYPTDWDQHWLLACVAPRHVYVGASSQDAWADPLSEMLCCMAASPAWNTGLVHSDRFLKEGEFLHDGDVGFHLCKGPHTLNYPDWLLFLDFVRKHF